MPGFVEGMRVKWNGYATFANTNSLVAPPHPKPPNRSRQETRTAMVVAGKNNGVNVSKPEVVLVSDSADNASDMMSYAKTQNLKAAG